MRKRSILAIQFADYLHFCRIDPLVAADIVLECPGGPSVMRRSVAAAMKR